MQIIVTWVLLWSAFEILVVDFVDPDGLEDPVEEVDEELDVADELETLSSEPNAKEK